MNPLMYLFMNEFIWDWDYVLFTLAYMKQNITNNKWVFGE